MKTIQGKEYDYSDILLYNVRNDSIIAIVNDEEQLKKFNSTGYSYDAPVVILPYSRQLELDIIASMKQIKNFSVLSGSDEKNVKVKYVDGTERIFDNSNLEVINRNLNEQNKLKKKEVLGSWDTVPVQEKEKNKNDIKKKLTKGLASVLAAAAIVGGIYHGGKFIKQKHNGSNPEDPRQTEESVTAISKFKKEGKQLYQIIQNSNPYITQYQQAVGLIIDEDMCVNIVEYMNGVYPTSMIYMNPQNATATITETRQAINLIIASNLFPDVKPENMIDLSAFIVDENGKALINNSMLVARSMINESIGEPMNGEIMNVDDFSLINAFSMQYEGAVSQFLHYQLDVQNSSTYLTLPAGTRFVISSIFQNGNNTVPEDSYVIRKSQLDPEEVKVPFVYFFDDYTKYIYLARITNEGNTIFVRTYTDEYGQCKEEAFAKEVMYAWAGLKTVDEQRELGITPNPTLHECGILNETNNRVIDAIEDFDQLIMTTGGMTK